MTLAIRGSILKSITASRWFPPTTGRTAPHLLRPTEDHVMHLAGKWGIDPTRVDKVVVEPALGFVGLAPMQWRAERHRKAAA